MVERIAERMKRPLKSMIGDSAFLKSLSPRDFADDRFGVPTVTDILSELEKPGRDPRPEFKTAEFMEGVEKISDLKPGMALVGVVTDVTAFGAFVDIGVHQDGLVHVSELADRFVKDPREIVKAGDVVRVRVKDVDVARKRIALTMKSGAIDTRNASTSAGSARPASPPPTSSRSSGGEIFSVEQEFPSLFFFFFAGSLSSPRFVQRSFSFLFRTYRRRPSGRQICPTLLTLPLRLCACSAVFGCC